MRMPDILSTLSPMSRGRTIARLLHVTADSKTAYASMSANVPIVVRERLTGEECHVSLVHSAFIGYRQFIDHRMWLLLQLVEQ